MASANILVLGPDTTMGWARCENGKVSSGSVNFKPTHFDSVNSRFSKSVGQSKIFVVGSGNPPSKLDIIAA